MTQPHVYIALPAMDEAFSMPHIVNAVLAQTWQNLTLVICVNQPEKYWDIPEKQHICEANQATLSYLKGLQDKRVVIIDKSSRGKGWNEQFYGVGAARRTLMDYIVEKAKDWDIIISVDADTEYGATFVDSVCRNFHAHPDAYGISIPYYHRLCGDEALDRAMLRYETYMRAYAINAWRIKSPYCFTALGSAIAVPVWAYKKTGGLTPKLSGEDFYFLQKIVKRGRLLHWNEEWVYPATRFSDRVFFGTGPALIKGVSGSWESYPIYHSRLFENISSVYTSFDTLFEKDIPTLLDDFFRDTMGELPWAKLRTNFKTKGHFVRACYEKFDGLRMLQYLKSVQFFDENESQKALKDLFVLYSHELGNQNTDFWKADIASLDNVRNALFDIEMNYRKNDWEVVFS